MTDFSTADPSTWDVVLDAEQIAAIFKRSVCGLKSSCAHYKFVPAPFQRKPYRWRKADVIRHLGLGKATAA